MVNVVLVGIGGYGAHYLQELLARMEKGELHLIGVVDPFAEKSSKLKELRRLRIPCFPSLEDFYREREADLAVISSPIPFHCEQTCLALSRGSHVLCEKPAALRIEQVLRMIEYRNRYRRSVVIGYQWAFSHAVQALKRDILKGRFGKPIRLKTMVLWPRNEDYFARGWAGKIKDASGRWVLDSVAGNATAHYLQNMFFILGDSLSKSAMPTDVTAETYRANRIENFDTAAVRAHTAGGAEILFLATHAVRKEEHLDPMFEYEFENARIFYTNESDSDLQKDRIQAVFKDGTRVDYGSPHEPHFSKIDTALEAVRDPQTIIPCGLETASAHTLCMHGVRESVPDPVPVPRERMRYDRRERLYWVEGLADAWKHCYEHWKMPHETEISWAQSGGKIDLRGNELIGMIGE